MAGKPSPHAALVRACARDDAALIAEALAGGLRLDEAREDGLLPLHYACEEAAANVVRALLDAGAAVDAWTKVEEDDVYAPRTALMLAAKRGSVEIVDLLLARGADPRAVKAHDGRPGKTALFHVCAGGKGTGHERVLERLLDAGLAPDAMCLVWAAKEGSAGMVRALVAAGAPMNEVTSMGTPLHAAVADKRFEAAELLLELGADPTVPCPPDHRSYPGQSALDLARATRQKKLVALLESAQEGRRPANSEHPASQPAELSALWKRLEKALAAPVTKSLAKGASDKAVRDAGTALGVAFPADLAASYRVHDGQKPRAPALFPEDLPGLAAPFCLVSLDDMVRHAKTLRRLCEKGELGRPKAGSDARVRPEPWHSAWIPFASDGGGDFLCVDLAPAKGGAMGQVVLVRHDAPTHTWLAESLAALMASLLELLVA